MGVWRSLSFVTLLVLAFMSSARSTEYDMLVPTTASSSPQVRTRVAELKRHAWNAHVQTVQVREDLISAATPRLRIALDDGRRIEFGQTRFETNSDGTVVWYGEIAKPDRGYPISSPTSDPLNRVLLVRHGHNVVGTINVAGQLYELDTLGQGLHVLARVNADRLPNGDDSPRAPVVPYPKATTPGSDAASTIRVLTVASRNVAESGFDVVAKSAEYVAYTNQTFRDSGIQIVLENAGGRVAEDYDEAIDENTEEGFGMVLAMLARISTRSEPTLGAPTRQWRNDLRADLVLGVTRANHGYQLCGFSGGISSGFAAMKMNCGARTWAHELGHNLGAHHENVSHPDFPGGRGHCLEGSTRWYATIMAISCALPQTKLAYWSTPLIQYDGMPLGIAGQKDNARVLNQTRHHVAEYYPAPGEPTSPNVVAVALPATVAGMSRVRLSASGTSNPVDSALQYHWTQESGPSAVIEDERAVTTYAELPAVTEATAFTFRVRVTNDEGNHSDRVLSIQAQAADTMLPCAGLPVWRIEQAYHPGQWVARLGSAYQARFGSRDLPPELHVGPAPSPWETRRDCSVAIAPTIGLKGPAVVAAGAEASLDAGDSHSHYQGATLRFEWTLPADYAAEAVDQPVLQFTAPPLSSPRQDTIGLRVSDARGHAQQQHSLTVRPGAVNRPPTGTLQPSDHDPLYRESGPLQAVLLTAQADDPDGDSLTYEWELPPGWVDASSSDGQPNVRRYDLPTVNEFTAYTPAVTVRDSHGDAIRLSRNVVVYPKGMLSLPRANIRVPDSAVGTQLVHLDARASSSTNPGALLRLELVPPLPGGFEIVEREDLGLRLRTPVVSAPTEYRLTARVHDGMLASNPTVRRLNVVPSTSNVPTTGTLEAAVADAARLILATATTQDPDDEAGAGLTFDWAPLFGVMPLVQNNPHYAYYDIPIVAEPTQATIRLRVTDSANNVLELDTEVTLPPPPGGVPPPVPPQVEVTGPMNALPGAVVPLRAGGHSDNFGAAPLVFTWEGPDDLDYTADGALLHFTAPAVPGETEYDFTVTASDGVMSAVTTHTVHVLSPDGNRRPRGTLLASPTAPAGQPLQFTALVSDPDGDPITYHWVRPAGWTGAENEETAVWAPPAVAQDTPATIAVNVEDDKGGLLALSSPIIIVASAAPMAHIEGSHEVGAGQALALSARASTGTALRFEWSAPGFDPASSTDEAPIFTAPGGVGVYPIQLRVIDGAQRSHDVTHEVTVGSPDTVAPARPTGLQLVGEPATSTISLDWNDASDNIGVVGYQVSSGSTPITDVPSSEAQLVNLAPDTLYLLNVVARDAAGNTSPRSASLSVRTLADTQPPTMPVNLRVMDRDARTITVSWDAATDDGALRDYRVYRNDILQGNLTGTSFTYDDLLPGTGYRLKVVARDASGNVSEGAVITAETLPAGK